MAPHLMITEHNSFNQDWFRFTTLAIRIVQKPDGLLMQIMVYLQILLQDPKKVINCCLQETSRMNYKIIKMKIERTYSLWAELEYSNLARRVYVPFYIPLAMKVRIECVKLCNGCALPTQLGLS